MRDCYSSINKYGSIKKSWLSIEVGMGGLPQRSQRSQRTETNSVRTKRVHVK